MIKARYGAWFFGLLSSVLAGLTCIHGSAVAQGLPYTPGSMSSVVLKSDNQHPHLLYKIMKTALNRPHKEPDCKIHAQATDLHTAVAQADLTGVTCTIYFSGQPKLSKTLRVHNHSLVGTPDHANGMRLKTPFLMVLRYQVVSALNSEQILRLVPRSFRVIKQPQGTYGYPVISPASQFTGDTLLSLSGTASLKRAALMDTHHFNNHPLGIEFNNHQSSDHSLTDIVWIYSNNVPGTSARRAQLPHSKVVLKTPNSPREFQVLYRNLNFSNRDLRL